MIRSDVIGHRGHPGFTSTMGTTEERALRLDPMPQDPTATVITHWCQLLYGALKAIEGMRLAGRDHLKREVVIVAADFTASHASSSAVGSVTLPS
jgi:hypothetical protein